MQQNEGGASVGGGGREIPTWIRPMGYDGIVAVALKIYKSSFVNFLKISIVNVLPALLMAYSSTGLKSMLQPNGVGNLEAGLFSIALYGVGMIIALFTYVWSKTAIIYMGSQHFLGRPCNFAEAARVGMMLFGPSFAGMILFWIYAVGLLILCCFVPLLVLSIGAKNFGVSGSMLGAILLLIGLTIYFIFLLRYWLWHQVLIVEGKRGWNCMRRSHQLMKELSDRGMFRNHIWQLSVLLTIVFAIYLGVWMVGATLSVAVHFGLGFSSGATYDTFASAINYVSAFVQGVLTPFSIIIVTLFYYNIRIRKEGLESQLRTPTATN